MPNSLAVVTGASTGIGLELARLCAENGFDLVIAADEPEIEQAAIRLRPTGVQVTPVQADLATAQGCDALLGAIDAVGRPVDALLANAGRGLGKGFLDQDLDEAIRVVDTNITGTLWITQKIGRDMRSRGAGRILFTGSIAGLMPGTFQAVYNGTKAFIDSFSVALRHELRDTGVTVTCLMPGATDTEFFRRADMLDTQVGQDDHKDDPADVAQTGFDAMMRGDTSVVHGVKNKVQAAMTNVLSDDRLAEQHRKMAEPGSAQSLNRRQEMKLVAFTLGLSLLASPAWAAGEMKPATEGAKAAAGLSANDFAERASVSGMFEIQSGKLALKRSNNPKIRDFAQMMVADHEKAAAKLKQIHPEGVAAEMDRTHRDTLGRLQTADSKSFDTAYVAEQTTAHQKAVELFGGYASGGDNAALKAFAAETLPTLRAHLEAVKKLN